MSVRMYAPNIMDFTWLWRYFRPKNKRSQKKQKKHDMIIKNYKYSSSYLTLEDSAVVEEVSTKLDSNQPTMSPPNPLG